MGRQTAKYGASNMFSIRFVTAVGIVSVLTIGSGSAFANPVSMVCSGADGDYQVVFDDGEQRLTIGDEEYPIVVPPVTGGGQSYVMVFDGGPIVAMFEPMQMVQYSNASGTEVVREDKCRQGTVVQAGSPSELDLSVRQIQEMLNALGYDAGPADGIEGRRTRNAIAAFQQSLGEPATGTLTQSQMADLAEQTEGSIASVPSKVKEEAQLSQPDQSPLPTFRDCAECPEMAIVPKGSFMMGATDQEEQHMFIDHVAAEHPRHEVTIDYSFAIGRFEVTTEQFDAYVKETGSEVGGICSIRLIEKGPNALTFTGTRHPEAEKYEVSPFHAIITDGSYAQPGLPITGQQPAVCVSRLEILGYLDWLSQKTGRTYRLPSEAEWEYAARAGTDTVAFWGDSLDEACLYANFADRTSGYQAGIAAPCAESIRPEWTAPVGSYKPNPWGLHDMAGNVQELVEDCRYETYEGAPGDGSAWTEPDCSLFVARGGDYELMHVSMRASERLFWGYVPEVRTPYGADEGDHGRSNVGGFRVAADLDESAAVTSSGEQGSNTGDQKETWIASSTSAIAITGDITIQPEKLTFQNGAAIDIAFVEEREGNWSMIAFGPGKIFQVPAGSNPVLLNDNVLCGPPVTHIVLSKLGADGLSLSVYSSETLPTSFGDGGCAVYNYSR